MPFTPFHFGLGLAAKAILTRRFSFGLFVALQVIIDLESLYNLVYGRHPVHRFLHTFVGAGFLALLASVILYGGARYYVTDSVNCVWPSRRLFPSLMAMSLFATWSHVVLDGVMHRDTRPLWPMTDQNPFLSIVPLSVLHLACVALGFFGLVALVFRASLRA